MTYDSVLVISPNTPSGNWPIGRITEVYEGNDGHVTIVKVKFDTKEIIRPI